MYSVGSDSYAASVTKDEAELLHFIGKNKVIADLISLEMNLTRRKIGMLLETLRLKGVPVLGGRGGIWLSSSPTEIDGYTKYLSKVSQKKIKSEFDVIKSLRDTARLSELRIFQEDRPSTKLVQENEKVSLFHKFKSLWTK